MFIIFAETSGKEGFQAGMLLVVELQKFYEVQQIGIVKGAVYKTQKAFSILGLMVYNKIVWSPIHKLHEVVQIVDDGGSLSPCQ